MEAIFPFKALKRFNDVVNKEQYFQIAKLAVNAAGLYYKTRLITDSEGKNLFLKNGIRFDTVEILDDIENYTGNNPCFPKVFSMISRKRPYVMLDFDSILTKDLPIDLGTAVGFLEVDLTRNSDSNTINYLNNNYIKDYTKTLFGEFAVEERNINWSRIPSMSLFFTDAPDLVSKTFNTIIKIYGLHSLDRICPQIFEQLLFFNFFSELNYDLKILQNDGGEDIKNPSNFYIHLSSDIIEKYRYMLPYLESQIFSKIKENLI